MNFFKKTMGLAYVDVLKYFFHSGRHQLMSQVGGGKTGNRLRWSIPL